MYLLEGKPAPDHATFARFVSLHFAQCSKKTLAEVSKLLYSLGEISGKSIFIDGTKIESVANKYTFVWKKSVGKWEAKMFQKVQEAVSLLNQEYLQSFSVMEETRTQDLQKICQFLEQICKEQHTVFVHGRGKHKSRNQKYLELFRRFLERQTIYDWHTASFQGRNNYCKTDPDATFMHVLLISATPYQWKHMIGQRSCRRNTDEMRIVILKIWKALYDLSPALFLPELTGPFCQRGQCLEGKMGCGHPIAKALRPTDILLQDYPLLMGGDN